MDNNHGGSKWCKLDNLRDNFCKDGQRILVMVQLQLLLQVQLLDQLQLHVYVCMMNDHILYDCCILCKMKHVHDVSIRGLGTYRGKTGSR